MFPGAVTVTRPRHPMEGRELSVLGRMRRHGQPELLLVFPDGAKRLVPESWTDAVVQEEAEGPGTLGTAADLLGLSVLISALCAASQNGSRLHESHLPGRTIVQPVQLSLLPEEVPAPLPELISQLPEEEVTEAVAQLARLIARIRAAAAKEAGDER